MPAIQSRSLRTVLMAACSCITFGLVMLGLQVPFVFLVLAAGIVWRNTRRIVGSGWSHGSAAVAGFAQLIRSGLLGQDGLILGTDAIMVRPTLREGISALWSRSHPPDLACYLFLLALGGRKWVKSRMIRLSHFTHLATFAPTGRGKSIYVLMLNLLSYRRSCVVVDPKGELLTATGLHRQNRLGHKIFLLDPYGICKIGSNTFNPLDFILDEAPDFIEKCRDLANMMIIRSGTETDPHWNDSAELVLTAFIAFVCACEDDPKERNLEGVRALISSRDSYLKSIAAMQKIDSHNGVIMRLGEQLTWLIEKELGSVMSTLQRQTAWLDSPIMKQHMSSSNFHPLELRQGLATVYLCLPSENLETLAPLMRLWLGVILRTITQGKATERNPVLFLIDEAAHIGKIRALENAVTLMRGMGIRLWFFFQSIHQLQECYGEKAKTFIDNIDTQQYFGTHSFEAADELSKRIGDTTISVTSYGETKGYSYQEGQKGGSTSTSSNTNVSQTGRRLYKPEEILVTAEQFAFVFHRNLPVIASWLVAYFDHPAFAGGGTGQQTALDRSASGKAAALLLASVLFAGWAFMLPPFQSQPTRPARFRPVAQTGKALSKQRTYPVPYRRSLTPFQNRKDVSSGRQRIR
jgi:type IV secretion system protein VirD4